MSEHVVVFGSQYRNRAHPFFGDCPDLPDHWGVVEATDYRRARELCMAAFGPAWLVLHMGSTAAQRHRDPEWDEHYPAGQLFHMRPDTVGQPVITFPAPTPSSIDRITITQENQ